MIVVIGVPQAVLDHGVHQLLVAHASAPAGVHGGKGSGAHVLGAAADDDIGVAGEDGAAGLDDGLHAGAADHADGVGRNGVGQARAHADLTGDVLTKTGGQDAAEHDLVHLLGLHAGTVQSLFDDDGTQIDGRGVLQRAAKGTNRGSAAIHNIKISHSINPSN